MQVLQHNKINRILGTWACSGDGDNRDRMGEMGSNKEFEVEGVLDIAVLLRAKDPKVRHARICITAAGLVLQGIVGSECWPLDALI